MTNESERASTLQRAFHFSEQDLRENRLGKLSAAQANRLRTESRQLLFLVVGVLAGVGVLTLLSIRFSSTELFYLISCLSVPALLTFAFTLGTTEAAIGPRAVSKRTGQIHLSRPGMGIFDPPLQAEDIARLAHSPGLRLSRAGQFMLIIEDQVFRLGQEEHAALRPSFYTVYYVPQLNKVVAVEPIVPADTDAIRDDLETLARQVLPGTSPVHIAEPLDNLGEDVRA
jgi:hypothetical protein